MVGGSFFLANILVGIQYILCIYPIYLSYITVTYCIHPLDVVGSMLVAVPNRALGLSLNIIINIGKLVLKHLCHSEGGIGS